MVASSFYYCFVMSRGAREELFLSNHTTLLDFMSPQTSAARLKRFSLIGKDHFKTIADTSERVK